MTISIIITMIKPYRLFKKKSVWIEGNSKIIRDITVKEVSKNNNKAKKEKHIDKLLDCNNGYSRSYSIIQLNYWEGLWTFVKNFEDPNKMWTILKRQYEDFDLVITKNILSWMICQTESDFETIAKYSKSIKHKIT